MEQYAYFFKVNVFEDGETHRYYGVIEASSYADACTKIAEYCGENNIISYDELFAAENYAIRDMPESIYEELKKNG